MGLEYDKKKLEKELRYKYMPYNAIFNLTQIGESNIDNSEFIPIPPPFAQTRWVASASHCTYVANEFNVYLGSLVVDSLIEVTIQTGLPTGNVKPNTVGDPDYIAPVLNPITCPTYQTEWIVDESTAYCELLEGENTGFKIYVTLLERIIGTTTLTGQTKPNTSGQPDYVAPVADPDMCPVTVEPPLEVFPFRWEGTSPYCITEDIVINEFDYLVLRYNWLPGSGQDMDIMVGYVNTGTPVDNDFVGFGQGGAIVPVGVAGPDSYLWWALDNQGTSGYEAVLINVKKLIEAYPTISDVIEVEMYCVWWSSVSSGDFSIEATTYLGGTMEVSGTNIVNTGGVQVSSDIRHLNTKIRNNDKNINTAYKVGVLRYNKLTDTAVLEISS